MGRRRLPDPPPQPVTEREHLQAMRQVEVLTTALERVGRWLDAGADPQYVRGVQGVIRRALEEAEV